MYPILVAYEREYCPELGLHEQVLVLYQYGSFTSLYFFRFLLLRFRPPLAWNFDFKKGRQDDAEDTEHVPDSRRDWEHTAEPPADGDMVTLFTTPSSYRNLHRTNRPLVLKDGPCSIWFNATERSTLDTCGTSHQGRRVVIHAVSIEVPPHMKPSKTRTDTSVCSTVYDRLRYTVRYSALVLLAWLFTSSQCPTVVVFPIVEIVPFSVGIQVRP